MNAAQSTTVQEDHKTATPPQSRFGLRTIIVDYGVVVFLAMLVIGFSIAIPGNFPTASNAQTIMGGQSVAALLALAVIIPLAAGEFDLSAGATLGFCAVISASMSTSGYGVGTTLLVTLLVGAIVGVLNGLIITVVGVGAFIATLGMATILSGGSLLFTSGTLVIGVPESFKLLGQSTLAGIPVTVFYVLALALILYYVLEWTPAGRYLRSTGSGRDAARLSGVRTNRWLFGSFVAAAVIAALAGFVLTCRIGSASPSAGPEFLLPAYAAAFLGATTIQPGRFNVWGTLVGVLVLAVGISGLNLAGAPFWVPPVFNGTALLLAVSISVWVSNRKRAEGSSA